MMSERLTPIHRAQDLAPWRRASDLTRCFLYWIPVHSFPIPGTQREWLMEFLSRWTKLMRELGLRPETFLQYKVIYPDLMDALLNNMMELIPVMGLGRKPGAPLPKLPSESEVQKSTKNMFDALMNNKPADLPDAKSYMPDYSYWFVEKSDQKQRQLFLGHGGFSMTFLKPDPNTVAPPLPITPALRKKIPMLEDMEKKFEQANSLKDAFLRKSKELFGEGLEKEPQMKGIPFILPLLDAGDFFSQPEEVIKNSLQLFDVYVRESPADRGLLLAANFDVEEKLIGILQRMREDKFTYPEA